MDFSNVYKRRPIGGCVVGATIAFYGPNLGQATKVVVGVVPSEHAESELGNWMVKHGDVRSDAAVAGEILEYMEGQGVLSAVLTEGIIGCPDQER
jgi:L-arabinose isomerase